jgi:hypothetical protein
MPSSNRIEVRSPIFNSQAWPVQEYCKLILSAEDFEQGSATLRKVVHMPLDPDILLWILKSKPFFMNASYSQLNTRYTFEQVRQYAIDQARRQIFYFSQMLRKGMCTKEQLERKMEPYMSVDTAKGIFARVMRIEGTPVIRQTGEIHRSLLVFPRSHRRHPLLKQNLYVYTATPKDRRLLRHSRSRRRRRGC